MEGNGLCTSKGMGDLSSVSLSVSQRKVSKLCEFVLFVWIL